jgi:hypothetical protein
MAVPLAFGLRNALGKKEINGFGSSGSQIVDRSEHHCLNLTRLVFVNWGSLGVIILLYLQASVQSCY